MRSPSSNPRNLLLRTCPKPTYSVIHPEKPQSISRSILFSITSSSSHISGLSVIDSVTATQLASIDTVNSPVQNHGLIFKGILKNSSAHNLPNSLLLNKNGTNGELANSEINKWLKHYSGMLRIFAVNGSLNEGKAVHGQVVKDGIDPDSHLLNSLVNFYAKCGSFQCAHQVLDDMPERDVVSWTALISGLVKEGYGSDAMNLYCKMRRDGVRPNDFALATCLRACSLSLELDFGTQLHAEVMKIGVFLNVYVGAALVDLYVKCGELGYANRVLIYMPEKNVVSWNALLNGYAQMGDSEKVLNIFSVTAESELKFSKFSLHSVLKSCVSSGNLRNSQVVHSLAIKIGHEIDELMGCCLLDMYSKFGMPDDALKVFKRLKNPNIVAWSAMINCLYQQGQSQEAAEMFHLMRQLGASPNEFTLASMVSVATNLGDWYYGESIHSCILKYGFESDNFVSNTLVTMYMKFGSVQYGWRVFKAMTLWDLTSWNAILSGFHDNRTYEQSPRIFNQMLVEGLKPDMYTFISILKSCASLSYLGFGKQVHAHIVKNGLSSNGSVGTTLVDMYSKSRCLEDALIIFNRLKERDFFSWTVIIAGYAQTDQGDRALKCFSQMQREGLKPNEFTLSSCLSSCFSLEMLKNGQQLHSLAMKSGLSGDAHVASALVNMYGKCRCIEDAEVVFRCMASRNTVSWNTMICEYSQHGQSKKALEAFMIMLDEGILPDEVTFVGVLSACSHMGFVEEGKILFESLSKVYGITPTIEHFACMVNILGRAGKFSKVESFIEEMNLTQNAFIWETILWTCKIHGNMEFGERAAKKLFELEPETDYNYILLSDIFAAKGRWDDVAKVRALMSNRGIKKEPGCCWPEVSAQGRLFYAQDSSHPDVKEICIQLGRLVR